MRQNQDHESGRKRLFTPRTPTAGRLSLVLHPKAALEDQAAKILAKSIFRSMERGGYGIRSIVKLSSELIELVTSKMKEEREKAEEASAA